MKTIFDYLYDKAETYWLTAAEDNFSDELFDSFRSPVDLYIRKDGTLVDHNSLTFNDDYLDVIMYSGDASEASLKMYCSGVDAFKEEPLDESILYSYLREYNKLEDSLSYTIKLSRYGDTDIHVDGDIYELWDELSHTVTEEPTILSDMDCSNISSLVNDIYEKLVQVDK